MYIISRHFKSDERIRKLLETISNEICNKVESILDVKTIFEFKNDKSEVQHLEETKQSIILGKRILNTWNEKFHETKVKLEEDGGDRWDFD